MLGFILFILYNLSLFVHLLILPYLYRLLFLLASLFFYIVAASTLIFFPPFATFSISSQSYGYLSQHQANVALYSFQFSNNLVCLLLVASLPLNVGTT